MSGIVPILSTRNFSKTFFGRTVLEGVNLDVLPGEVHGLIGQNGSGKSTFIKILSGYHAPDPDATLEVNGKPARLPLSPGDPARLGISFVHQDLGLFMQGSVLENLRVGQYAPSFGWRISWRRERQLTREALARFELDIDPDAPIWSLSQVDRALVAIVRALEQIKHTSERGLLVLDEPTSFLPRDGVDHLFKAIREVAGLGFGVLFVSHRLEEVRALTDRVSVFRNGKLVEVLTNKSLMQDDLITPMLGFALSDYYPQPSEAREGSVVLSVRDVTGAGVRGLSLDIRSGEIVGLTGLLGMGQDGVIYLLFGAEKADSGMLMINGKTIALSQFTPVQARHAGLALLPSDRLRQSGVALATAAENITLSTIGQYFRGGWLRKRAEIRRVSELMADFDVRPPEPSRLLGTFSGGNQQKALLAKWFDAKPKVLLLHEPTQGVDVGARRQIFRQIQQAADSGITVMIASTEYEDLAALCDRVFVFRNQRAVAELSGEALTLERILEQCYRDERASSPALAENRN